MLGKKLLIASVATLFLFASVNAFELYGLGERELVDTVVDMFGGGGPADLVETPLTPFCATPLLLDLAAVWGELSDEARQAISAHVAVPNFAEIEPVYDEPAKNGSKKSIWPHGEYATHQYQTEHFNIKWGGDADYDNSTIEMLGEALEDAWDIEVEEMGYPQPAGSDEYYLDFYIGNSGDDVPEINFQGAYTTIYEDYPYPAYIVMHPDLLASTSVTRDVTSHEFFHVIQFGIVNRKGCFYGNDDRWWWEATAVWMEDEVWDDINNYAYFIDAYTDAPWESLHSQKKFYYQYSRCIWAKYLSENHGGRDAIYSIWTTCDRRGVFVGTDDYLTNYDGYSLGRAFSEFMAKNAVLDYEEKDLYESLHYEFVREAVHSAYPVSATVDASGTTPRYLGANIIEFLSSYVDGPMDLAIGFNGDSSSHSYSVRWRAQLLIEMYDGSYQTGIIPLDEDSDGSVSIEGFGGDVVRVFLIPSVVEWKFAGGENQGVSYAYAAQLEEPSGGDDDDGGGGDSGGCGCAF